MIAHANASMRTLFDALDHFATHTPNRPAIVLTKQSHWTQLGYGDLKEETDRWARLWLERCPAKGGVVFIILPHGISLYPAFLGAMRAGLIPSFLPYPTPKQDPLLYWSSHEALFKRVQPACILSYRSLIPALGDILGSSDCQVLDIADLQDAYPRQDTTFLPFNQDTKRVALLQHSSGTTGLKKGVALTYEQIREQLASCADAIGATEADKIISWLPVYHDMGLISSFLLPISIGAMVVSLDAFEWLTKPDALLTEIERFRCTLCWLPNFAFNHLVRTRDRDARYELSSMRAFINCSEPCKPETVELFHRTFDGHGLRPGAVQACYGMAEMVFAATHTALGCPPRVLDVDRGAFNDRAEIKQSFDQQDRPLRFLSCGRPIDGVELRIVPKEPGSLRRVQDGVIGEIQVNGRFRFDGYFRNERANEAGFDGAWFRSGDIGFLHDGELYVCGRIKEMLIVHGRNFYANDIEEVVNRVSGIKPGRVVAVGLYDPVTASEEAVVIAETTLPDDGGRMALGEAIRSEVFSSLNLSLRHVEIANEGTLIKTTSGKISREENVKRIGAGVFA